MLVITTIIRINIISIIIVINSLTINMNMIINNN